MASTPELPPYQLEQKKLISEVFNKFNNTLQAFRDFQKKLEQQIVDLRVELSEKNEQLSNILESLASGLFVTDLTGTVISFNRAAYQITGIKPGEIDNKPINEVLGKQILPSPLAASELVAKAQHLTKGFWYAKPSGQEVFLEVTVTVMKATAEHEPRGIIVNINDLTALKKLEAESERKNRLVAMGQIAATVAHEIRNPLGGMELFVSMLKKDLQNSPQHASSIEQIQSAMRSMNHIISNILEYASPRYITKKKIDLVRLSEQFIKFYQPHAEQQNITLSAKYQVATAIISGDAELLKQLLQNLYMNAGQAMAGGGEIIIELSKTEQPAIAPGHLAAKTPLADRPKMFELAIIDHGEGMSAEMKKKIFDPFFTTKPKGTGIGMSIVNQIVNAHDGQIAITSRPGQGTKVALKFFAAD